MGIEALIFDRDSARFAAGLRAAVPEMTFHSATTLEEARGPGATADVLLALAPVMTPELIALCPRLAWVQALTSGTENLIAFPNLGRDVLVTSARGAHGPQMAELAMLFMLWFSRSAPRFAANQAARKWERWPQPLLLGKTVTIVGVGTISEEVAHRCRAFGMRVVGVSDSRAEARGFDAIHPRATLHGAVAEADYVVVLAPHTPATHHMIDAGVLAAMKPSAVLINIARGALVDEAALIAALRADQIAGAGLDVFETEPLPASSPLWAMERVLITPHIGGLSDSYHEQLLPIAIENLRAYVAGDRPAMRNIVKR